MNVVDDNQDMRPSTAKSSHRRLQNKLKLDISSSRMLDQLEREMNNQCLSPAFDKRADEDDELLKSSLLNQSIAVRVSNFYLDTYSCSLDVMNLR